MSSDRIIKFQQSQALTSHFESFWSIVEYKKSKTRDKSLTHLLTREHLSVSRFNEIGYNAVVVFPLPNLGLLHK